MSNGVVILDYQMGNLHSILKKMRRLKVETTVTADPSQVKLADKIILPGVGHFGRAMNCLKERELIEPLRAAIQERGVPVLGICLGMQLMTDWSEEGEAQGLGFVSGKVTRFRPIDTLKHKVPHIGWNQVEPLRDGPLFEGIDSMAEFYFVHSYHVRVTDESDALAKTDYEGPFVSAFQRRNVFGVQFHPEKSHDNGERMLANFLNS